MRARVFVTLKDGVFDPQGEAIRAALVGLGFAGVESVRQGKVFDLDLSGAAADGQAIEAMCRKLLANGVIEDFRVETGG